MKWVSNLGMAQGQRVGGEEAGTTKFGRERLPPSDNHGEQLVLAAHRLNHREWKPLYK